MDFCDCLLPFAHPPFLSQVDTSEDGRQTLMCVRLDRIPPRVLPVFVRTGVTSGGTDAVRVEGGKRRCPHEGFIGTEQKTFQDTESKQAEVEGAFASETGSKSWCVLGDWRRAEARRPPQPLRRRSYARWGGGETPEMVGWRPTSDPPGASWWVTDDRILRHHPGFIV